MPLGDTTSFADHTDPVQLKEIMRPAQVASDWITAIDAGGVDDDDNAAADISNPEGQIITGTRKWISVKGRGTTLLLRFLYDDGLTGITDPVLQVFGRLKDTEKAMRLTNKNKAVDITMATAANDTTDGTMKYTTVDNDTQAIDLKGCDEILIGVKTKLAGTGTTSNALVEAKVI